MPGTADMVGSVRPFSQFRIVKGSTPMMRAASFWVNLRVSRQCLTCSPRVRGSKSVSFGFSALSLTGRHGKKATRPCRCGHLDDPQLACNKAPRCAAEYQIKISGPLFDRIDLHVDVPAVDPLDLNAPSTAESSATVAKRVAAARALQSERYAGTDVTCNAEVDGELLEKVAAPDAAGRELLVQAAERMKLSARGYHRILRVARTIADLEGAETVNRSHIAEALSYRRIMPGRTLAAE